MGVGGIGIVRLSGPQALAITNRMFSRPLSPRHATLGLVSGENFQDTALALYFPAPHSFTGEDVVEIQAHGGWHLINRIMQTAIQHGAVAAEPGEFTRTAVLNGKMSLTQAESTLEMIHAESDAELVQASRGLAGDLQKLLSAVESDLVAARAQIDAYLDYPEDLDSPEIPMATIQRVIKTLTALLDNARNGQLIKHGIDVCLIGCPNAGKSSLFNALIHDDRSIVTDIAGTTTDSITQTITHQGHKINLIDTAGLREGDHLSPIERQGIARAKELLQKADLLLIVVDATTQQMVKFPREKKHLILYNKADLCPNPPTDGIAVSAKTGKNLDLVLSRIIEMTAHTPLNNQILALTNQRQMGALQTAHDLLIAIKPEQALDQIAANLTMALHAVGKVTGTNVDDKTLDEIFSKFCLGK